MLKLSEIVVDVFATHDMPNTLDVKAAIKLQSFRQCIPEAREETILEARREVWYMLYGDLLKEMTEYTLFVMRYSAVPNPYFHELNERTQKLLTFIKP